MSLFHIFALSCLVLCVAAFGYAQQNPPVAPANYDEDKVGDVVLPDPLKTTDGTIVDSPELWNTVRRPELLKFFADEMFGMPPLPLNYWKSAKVQVSYYNFCDSDAINGKALRSQMRIQFFKGEQPNEDDPAAITVLIYTPKNATGKVPAFIGLNFQGNHTVDADPGILLGTIWNRERQPVPAKEEERGVQASRWQIEKILDRGYAVVTAYYQDIEPDFDGGSKFGVRRLIEQKGEPNEGNTIATWAWGLSLIRNFVTIHADDLNIDPDKIIVHGHSRLGKTALWAGAIDPKFAIVISNNSGCGGAALSRRNYGETVHRINTAFPHWFNGNFKKYNLDVNAIPFDQHELVALIAPRPVYIASAVEDRWADPKGEFLSGLHADPVYRLLGTDGIAGVTEMPELNRSVGGTIGYHIRTGKHDVTEFDWEQFLNFADKHLR